MKIYLLEQNEQRGYDTYDSCIVAADSPDEAARMHPRGGTIPLNPSQDTWADNPMNVKVTLIGYALPDTKKGVVLASYNAG